MDLMLKGSLAVHGQTNIFFKIIDLYAQTQLFD